MHAARLALLAMTAALVATALPTAADVGQLRATEVEYDGPSAHMGQLALLLAADGVGSATGSDDGARPWIDFEAAQVHAVQYEESRVEGSVPGPMPLVLPGPDEDVPETTSDFTAARAHLTAWQPGFELHIFTLDGAIDYTLEASGGEFASSEEARMGTGGWNDPAGQGAPADGEQAPRSFSLVERQGPWVNHESSAPKASFALQGTFTVELKGVTLLVEDADGNTAALESGTWRSPLDPNAPPAASDAAYKVTTRFVRLQLTDAVLEFATDGGAPGLFWAASAASVQFSGRAAVLGAVGTLDSPQGGEIDLRNERHVLPESSRVAMTPLAGSTLLLDVDEAPLSPHGATIADVPAPASAALIGTGAVLALAIAVGIGVLRRVLRLPALADVETAIEEGEYGKAARMAARILSRLPGSEEALLGRAIALSKVGRHHDVVAEVTRHLALRPASDGTLHYVLGLAQLDSGKTAEGQASLREAVRLTPALQAEVAPRLGKAFSVAQPTTRETNGYA